jgi:hypothetical protein
VTGDGAVDRLDIIDICTRWHRYVDRKCFGGLVHVLDDWVSLPTLEEVASPGFDIDTYLGHYRRSRDDVIRLYPDLLDGLITQHLVAGHLVEVRGDTAVCEAQSINVHIPADGSGGAVHHGNAYRFDLVRTRLGWRVAGRVTWQLWNIGDSPMHDVAVKQRRWLTSMTDDREVQTEDRGPS